MALHHQTQQRWKGTLLHTFLFFCKKICSKVIPPPRTDTNRRLWILIILILLSPCNCVAKSDADDIISGRVIKVLDGDSIVVRLERSLLEVRLYGIDTPEYGQPYSAAAKQFVKNMTNHKYVSLKPLYKDAYGRTVAVVQIGSSFLNEELVRAGLAWVYKRYCRKNICKQWEAEEELARQNRKGLWAAPNPVSPWRYKWRKKR